MKVLHIDASPRPDSCSRRLARHFLEGLGEAGPVELQYRDVAANPVPHITDAWTQICDNVMRDGITDVSRLREGARTSAQKTAWSIVEPMLAEVLAADLIVLASPMYNYSVPSALKAWLDQITFPRMNLAPRRFVLVASRGGAYGTNSPKAGVEHHVRYLSDFLVGHFAVEAPAAIAVDLSNSTIDPLLADRRPEHEASLAAALVSARSLAAAMQREEALS